MNDVDPELDRRLALLRDVAEPTAADKHRLLVALRTSIHAHADSPARPVPPERAVGVARNRQPWAAAVRPLVPWLGGVLIGASTTLAIVFGWDHAPSVRDAAPTASGGGAAVAAANEDTNTTAGPRGISGARPTPQWSGRAAPDRSVPPAASPALDLAEALEQVHRAERALYAGDTELALRSLSDLDRRAGPALLREERLTTLVLALCQGDRVEEALDARRQLEREFASSIYARRLDTSCAAEHERR
jgi:hypothetical protein